VQQDQRHGVGARRPGVHGVHLLAVDAGQDVRVGDATWCTVRAVRDGASVALEIVNDGPATAVGTGSGLAGLDTRARELGGRLVVEHDADRFSLRLDVPVEPA
jgi:hypothetical protein